MYKKQPLASTRLILWLATGFVGVFMVLILLIFSAFSQWGLKANACTVSGSDNKSKVYNLLISELGLTAEQAAGVAGNIQSESGFQPLRHEDSQSWSNGGWGLVQWTGGRRDKVVSFVKNELGAEIFDQYYTAENGGKNPNIPSDINEKFLRAEIKYIKVELQGSYKSVWDGLKASTDINTASDIWLRGYEAPSDIAGNQQPRRDNANEIYNALVNTTDTCFSGDLVSGGMDINQGESFMRAYADGGEESEKFTGKSASCSGGKLANCVSFSVYFINKYTNIKGFANESPGNGNQVVENIKARNPSVQVGQIPQVYSVFSSGLGSGDGHTGVILGINTETGIAVIGEANCGRSGFAVNGYAGIDIRTASISSISGNGYHYAYIGDFLKGNLSE